MKQTEAMSVVHYALMGYVEDCAGAGSEEAKNLEKAWDILKENLPETDKFPNGFVSWHETHAEICAYIGQHLTNDNAQPREEEDVILDNREENGRTSMYDLAKEWTDEFELLNLNRQWDGEFFDEIDNFVKRKNANQ